jgi:hypothetical protein
LTVHRVRKIPCAKMKSGMRHGSRHTSLTNIEKDDWRVDILSKCRDLRALRGISMDQEEGKGINRPMKTANGIIQYGLPISKSCSPSAPIAMAPELYCWIIQPLH